MVTEYWAHHYDDLFHQGKLDSEAETEDWDRELEAFLKEDSGNEWETVIDE